MMAVDLATPADPDRVMEIVAACVRQFEQAGSTQWNDQYPNRDIFTTDLEANSLCVLRENKHITGAVVLNEQLRLHPPPHSNAATCQ